MKALSPTAEEFRPSGTTIYAVARQAGVSISTVSRVLRGTAPVAEETRSRVLAAVEDLHYRPNRLGRSLAEGRHAANGIVFPDLSGPYFAEVVLGYEEVAAECGRSVLILSTHGGEAARDMVTDLAGRVDGMVILGDTVDDDVIHDLAGGGLPLVLIARQQLTEVDAVTSENAKSVEVLARHLVDDHGYRDLVFLGDAESSPDTAQRWHSFREVLNRHGVGPPNEPVRCAFDEEAGATAAATVLRHRTPQVLVCANDEIALGAITAAEQLGLAVPGDVAVTGWDDIMAARHSRPGLTTVRQPMRPLGEWAARRLHERLSGDRSEPQHEILPTELVVRSSCGRHDDHNVEEDR